MRRPLLALLLMAASAVPAAAQSVVISDRTDATSVTLYRMGRNDGARNAGPESWPDGYALITETRTISLPAGRTVIRFEGVAQGMLPESAIVTGLPKGVVEKNRDALLLSPAGLVDGNLKRRVTVRRTDRATGVVKRQAAVIEAGPGGGVVLATAEGVEALGCSGLAEAIGYAGVPDGLFARPTLSIVADSSSATTARIQLSYIAEGFDWSAAYVAHVAEDGATLDLFAWLTLTNGGSEGFAGAQVQAVAGQVNKEAPAEQAEAPDPALRLQCWPMDVTSTHPLRRFQRLPWPRSGIRMLRNRSLDEADRREVLMDTPVAVTTLSAAMIARQEELGDLKLYRIPEPVTVGARSSKQVAMIDRKKVPIERIYGGSFEDRGAEPAAPAVGTPSAVLLRTENSEAKALGLPLPAGAISVFQNSEPRSLLIAEAAVANLAIGEEIEFPGGESGDVRYDVVPLPVKGKRQRFAIRVTNAQPVSVIFEFTLPANLKSASMPLTTRKGRKIWRTDVPANGAAKMNFVVGNV